MEHTPYRPSIEFAARLHAIDPDLLEALVIKESSGHADAFRFEPAFYNNYLKTNPLYEGMLPRRASSSYGLCQLMFSTARELGFRAEPEMLFLPGINLDLGAKHLAALLAWANGDERQALAAYNGGKGNWIAPVPHAYATSVLAIRMALAGKS